MHRSNHRLPVLAASALFRKAAAQKGKWTESVGARLVYLTRAAILGDQQPPMFHASLRLQ